MPTQTPPSPAAEHQPTATPPGSGRGARLTRGAAVWLCRWIAGVPFVVSGWAKAVDPAGFVLKLDEYLAVLGWHQPAEILLCAAIALAAFEFVTGVCLLTGMLRRWAPVCAAAMMAVMLPLTVWIAASDPVSDCGCFGDLLVLSNTATLVKNIVISLALVALFVLGSRRGGTMYRPTIQWVALLFTSAYILYVALRGYNVQPMVDFRPYKLGTQLATAGDDGDDEEELVMVYAKGGVEREFSVDSLPDDSWTYLRRGTVRPKATGDQAFAVFDADGEDVSRSAIKAVGYQLLVVVPRPDVHYLTRQRQLNELAQLIRRDGGSVIGLAGSSGDRLAEWVDLTLPAFDFYSADDTSLKALVRGDTGLVMLKDGRILWKRSAASLSPDFLTAHPDLQSVARLKPVDDGSRMVKLTALYLIALLLITPVNAIGLRRRNPKQPACQN